MTDGKCTLKLLVCR